MRIGLACFTGFLALWGSLAAAAPLEPPLPTKQLPVVAVIKFQDETGAMFMQGGAGRALTTMLTNELSANGSFSVVERQKLYAVIEEQDLSLSGRVAPETSIVIGRLTGAQYLVTGTITAFHANTETRTRGGMFGGGRVETISHGGYLAVDLRVIDTTSGEISYARTVEALTPPGPPREGGPNPLLDAPDSKAVRAAVLEIIDYLGCAMVRRDACLAEFEARDRARQQRTRAAADTGG